ncbi:MAG: DUF1887 family protein [Clostridiales bacterium]|nr:DUF1887 family protein [Clostridiales bacterium]
MTLVELFDKNPVENIISSLVLKPERVIFVGGKCVTDRHKRTIERLFSERGLATDIKFYYPEDNSLESAVRLLREIVNKYPDCEFDLTGGDDIMLVATGFLLSQSSDRKFAIHRYSLGEKRIIDSDISGENRLHPPFNLSVSEIINLYGGSILKEFKYENCLNMSQDFEADSDKLWRLCCQDTRLWNRMTGVLADFERIKEKGDNLETVVSISEARSFLSSRNQNLAQVEEFFSKLFALKLISDTGSDNAFIRYRYKNPQVKSSLLKAGTILELKVLLIAKSIKDSDGEPFFNDALRGVFIDWDGKRHTKPYAVETENEVDVILMRGHVPIFISCKNGYVEDDELYKLNTVAEKFGGPYSKKALVATSLSGRLRSLDFFRQRAKDMGIELIENVHLMPDSQLAEKIKGL